MKEQQLMLNDMNELSLIQLFKILRSQKTIIITITFIFILLGVAYILISKPVYEVQASITPPTQGDISLLNIGRGYIGYTTLLPLLNLEEVYKDFEAVLVSISVQHSFFNHIFLPSLNTNEQNTSKKDKLFDMFKNKIRIKQDKFDKKKYLITARDMNALKAQEWVKQYIALASKKAIANLMLRIKRENKNVLVQLKNQIDLARNLARKGRLDRIANLNESLKIAEAMGLKDQAKGNTAILDSVPMLYMRGSKSLESEIKTLRARENDDPFASNLRPLEYEYAFYSEVFKSIPNFKIYRVDGNINLPKDPIAPKPFLILILVLLGGLLMGSIVGFMRSASLNRLEPL